jgi:hypothetical protein
MSHDDSIMRQLQALQDTLRGSNPASFDPAVVVAPFIAVIRDAYLAGPYKLIALDTIQTLLSCNILQGCTNACDTLTEIVDAVTRCKFVQTDAVGDDLVTLRLVQVLHEVVKSRMRVYLNDASAWDIVESCYAVLVRGPYRSALSQVAEQTLFDTVRFIFSSATAPVASANGLSKNSLGFPCAVKLLAFFVNILKKHTVAQHSAGTEDGGEMRSPMGSIAEGSASGQATPSSSSGAQAGSSFQFLGDAPPDGVSSELVLAIKIISCMIVSEGDLSISRETILKCLPLVSLIRDDLGLCLILLASRTDLPPVVLQGVLSLFSTLVMSLGPMLYVLVEAFLVHVYLKSLNQLHTLLENSSVVLGEKPLDNDNGATINVAVANSTAASSAHRDTYSIEQLEMILESLLDALSDSSFLAMIFISFDCDPSRVDIMKPMFSYLCKCARYALAVEDSYRELGTLDVSTNMSLQCLMQVVTSLADRCDQVPADGDVDTPAGGASQRARRYQLSLDLRATRASKKILLEASKRFEKKPEQGLRFLQSVGALPTPLTPDSVAKFLRLSCDIPKEVVGSYLGELGKDNPKFEGDGKDFHKEVLSSYVASFPLPGQDILSCVRVFLSAFRLPGEAQQIDRILNAFSEHCFECCIENAENIVENAEIAYVLSFSLIMLNTDRHNVNIRADRKMTLEQFIKNNTNYGRDLKQTKDLPRDYLEAIYHSISSFPLRTERKDETGSVTVEGWMDAQQQATYNTEKGLLTMNNYENKTLEAMRQCIYEYASATSSSAARGGAHSGAHESTSSAPLSTDTDLSGATGGEEDGIDQGKKVDAEADRFFHPNLETVTQQAVNVVLQLLTTADASNKFDTSASLYGQQALVDADLAECIWKDLLPVIACPFMMAQADNHSSAVSGEKQSDSQLPAPNGDSSISIALAMAMAVIKISNWYDVAHACDAVVILFGDFAKVLKGNLVKSLFDNNGLLSAVSDGAVVTAQVAQSAPSVATPSNRIQSQQPVKAARKCLKGLLKGKSARAALCALLKLAHIHPQYLTAIGWTIVFQAMAVLRDLEILPGEDMVQYYVKDQAFDGIPGSLRNEFEMKMDASNAVADPVEEPRARVAIPRSKKSLLSFQGLGEALFGRSDDPEDDTPEDRPNSTRSASAGSNARGPGQKTQSDPAEDDVTKFMSIVSRWDFGYSDAPPPPTPASVQTPAASGPETPGRGEVGSPLPEHNNAEASNGFSTPPKGPGAAREGGHYGLSALRLAVYNCGVSEIISDSKFVDDAVILQCVQALVNLSDSFSGWGGIKQNACAVGDTSNPADSFDWSWNQHYAEADMVGTMLAESLAQLPELSLASTSWLEVVLVEVVVRNRDRMAALWPSLAVHYIRSAVALSTKASGDSVDAVTGARAASPLLQQPLEVVYKKLDPEVPILGFSYVDER